MKEDNEFMSAEEFFGDMDKQARSPLVRVSDHKANPKGQGAFEDLKVRMVMKLERCSKEEAVRIIAARAEELRAKENAKKDVNPFG